MGAPVSYQVGDWVVVTESPQPDRVGRLVVYDGQDIQGTCWVKADGFAGAWLVMGVRPASPEELAAYQLGQLAGGGL